MKTQRTHQTRQPGGVWSAAPTPFTRDMRLDTASVRRMVKHHLRLGIKGLFLAGTNGEGPWMTEEQRRLLVRTVAAGVKGKIPLAVQVTDNSAARILRNMATAREDGADIAVIAPPYFMTRATPDAILKLYVEAIRDSPLPVGIYDRGAYGAVKVPGAVLRKLYAEKNVVLVKDSSSDPDRRDLALAARRAKPSLTLLNGDEFHCVDYLKAGFDGLLLGGGVFNGWLAGRIMDAVSAGDLTLAERLQLRMNRLMFAVYGGKKIKCWLSGEKKLLVEMGIFSTWRNYPDYPLTPVCQRAIAHVMRTERDWLLPGERS
ncbi:MAG: dihydrodipicolinate synthase family protein [Kiritimatiellae bacterium]|nr:dihydrodipicolinate synthase family protein [Kiritimatiellia bacterium]